MIRFSGRCVATQSGYRYNVCRQQFARTVRRCTPQLTRIPKPISVILRADCRIDGVAARLEREVGTQASFYEPWEIGGVRIWLDAVDAIFDFMREGHGPCRLQATCSRRLPVRYQARLAVQDASARICPETVHPWCPLPEGGLRIEACFRGEACWLGAFRDASAHGGLDINHPKKTPLHAPIDLDDHFLSNATELGWDNNRWRGGRH